MAATTSSQQGFAFSASGCVTIAIVIVGVMAALIFGPPSVSIPGLEKVAAVTAAPFLQLFPNASKIVPLGIVLAAYLALRKWNGFVGVALGVLLVWLLAIGIPAKVNPKVMAEDRALRATDTAPSLPIEPTGIVGIIRGAEMYRNMPVTECDELCLALLYSGKATAVIMGESLESTVNHARLWRLEKGSVSCKITRESGASTIWSGEPDADAASLRGLLGDCPKSRPAAMALADIVIERKVIGPDKPISEDTSLLHPPASGSQLSIWRKGPQGPTLVARETRVNERRLKSPLHFETGGGAFSGPYLVLARVHREGINLPQLGSFIKLSDVAIKEPTALELRTKFDEWLDDPAPRDPEVTRALRGAAMKLMSGSSREPDDFARFNRLIVDRDGDGHVIEKALAEYPEKASYLLEASITRLVALPSDSDDQYSIVSALASFPPGSFADPPPSLLKLLLNPERAPSLIELFPRLADDNSRPAPLMMSLFKANFPSEGRANQGRIRGAASLAALHQLCRFGAPAAQYLPEIEALIAKDRETSFLLSGSLKWAVIQLRLGKPVPRISPPDEQKEDWERMLRQRVTKEQCIN